MDMLLKVIVTIVVVALGWLATYLQQKTTLIDAAKTAIDKAEAEYADVCKAGGAKFEWAVDYLTKLMPAPFNVIFPREMIAAIVQKTFDAMESYASKQFDHLADWYTNQNKSDNGEEGEKS